MTTNLDSDWTGSGRKTCIDDGRNALAWEKPASSSSTWGGGGNKQKTVGHTQRAGGEQSTRGLAEQERGLAKPARWIPVAEQGATAGFCSKENHGERVLLWTGNVSGNVLFCDAGAKAVSITFRLLRFSGADALMAFFASAGNEVPSGFAAMHFLQSLHSQRRLPCSQIALPPHSLHSARRLPCSQIEAPPHS